MAWKNGIAKGESGRFNIRLDDDTAAYFRTKAQEHGLSVSELLRRTLHDGAVKQNLAEFEQRMRAMVGTVLATAAKTGEHGAGHVPEALLQAVMTTEALLTVIVEAQDPQALYRAQDAARAKLARIKGNSHGGT